MARIIEQERPKAKRSMNSVALRENVNMDELKKKYMEDVKNGKFETEPRDVTKEQATEDFKAAAEFVDFFDLGEDIILDEHSEDQLETLTQIADVMEEASQEMIEVAESQRELVIEEDAADKIEQMGDFSVNEDDPLLAKDYVEKSEKLIKKLVLEKEKEERSGLSQIAEEAYEERSSSSSYNRSGYSTSSFQTSSIGSSKKEYEPVSDNESTTERKKRMMYMYGNTAEKMKDLAVSGERKKKKKQNTGSYYGRKKKWSFKGMVASVKRWFRSEDAALMVKVGSMLCLELALAIITKKYEFDNTAQLVSFLAMMLGVFYVSRELMAEGFDPRRISLL